MRRVINILSLSRILFAILFFYQVCFVGINPIVLSIIFALTVFSDYFDGKLARFYDLGSENGAKIDVISDFIFVFLSTLSLIVVNLIPVYYIFVIVWKMFEFFKTSEDGLYYDRFGHIVAVVMYVFPIMVVIFNLSYSLTFILTIFISISALFSSVLRIKNKMGGFIK